MIGVYFSGTGNTKYCVSKFLEYYNNNTEKSMYSIEDENCINMIKENNDIVFAYPIYHSDMPIIVRNFIENNKDVFKNKNIFIVVTMALFSGDGTGCSARVLKKYGANITGGLHVEMPDCIGDVRILKRSIKKNKKIVQKADIKIKKTVTNIKQGHYKKQGLSFASRLAGFFGQRIYLHNRNYKLQNKLKIDYTKCIGCGKCANICPMKNIQKDNNKVITLGKCTSCYRCINKCPKKAITLIGKRVIEQCGIDKYID